MDVSQLGSGYESQIGKILQNTVAKHASSPASNGSRGDEVVLSAEARQFNALIHRVKDAPDVRAELVNHFRAEVSSGYYTVDAAKLADKFLALA